MGLKSSALRAEKWIHTASRAFSWLSVIVLILMMLFITVDVVARYLFMNPIVGSIDFVVVMMVLLIFPSFGLVTFLNRHVRTDLIFDAISRRSRGGLDVINSVCSIVIIALISWQTGARAWHYIKHPPGITTDYFQWPHMPFLAVAALGCGLMCLELFIWFIKSVKQALHI